jgi:hypothetical protein
MKPSMLMLALAVTASVGGLRASDVIEPAPSVARWQESSRHKLIRRVVGAAACGLSMWDLAQTSKHVGRNGITEGNGLLSNANGTANLGAMSGLKIGFCAGPLVIGELGSHFHSSAMTNVGLFGSGASAAVGAFTVAHNQSVLNQQVSAQSVKIQPGTVAK